MSKYQIYLKLYPEITIQKNAPNNKIIGNIVRNYTNMHSYFLVNKDDNTDAYQISTYYISPIMFDNSKNEYISLNDYLDQAEAVCKYADIHFKEISVPKRTVLLAKTDQMMLSYSNDAVSIVPVAPEDYDITILDPAPITFDKDFIKQNIKNRLEESLGIIGVDKKIDISSPQKKKEKK